MKKTLVLFLSLFFTAILIIGPITTGTAWAKPGSNNESPLKGKKQSDKSSDLVKDAKSKGKSSAKKNIGKKVGTAAVTGLAAKKAKSGVKEKIRPETAEE